MATDKQMIIIGLDERGSLQYKINDGFQLHEVVGALQIIQRLLEAEVIQGTLINTDIKDSKEQNLESHGSQPKQQPFNIGDNNQS